MMNWSILAHIGNRPTIEAAFGMQRISNLLTQVKRALTNSCPEPKGRTHEGLGIFYSAKGFYAPLYKKLLVPVKFLHSLVKQHAIHKMQCTFTFQAGQQISSQCNLTCRLFAQYWKKKVLLRACVCSASLFSWLVGERVWVFFFVVVVIVRWVQGIYFLWLLILIPLFHCCLFEDDALVIHFLCLLPFDFFFHSGLFLLLIGCLACLLCCWVVYTCMLLLRKTDGVFAAAFAEVCVTRVLRWRNSEMHLFLPSLLFHWHDFFWLWMIYIV